MATRKKKVSKPRRARWKPKKRGEPNKLEQRHRDTVIEAGIRSGEYVEAFYECLTFAIQHDDQRISYTPDWVILRTDGEIECHEVKGGVWRGDSRIRFKLAAGKYPWLTWKSYLYSGSRPPKVEVL